MKTRLSFKLALSGLVIAVYFVVLYFTQSFSFRLIQFRVADALFGLAFLYPYLILPLALANALGNIIGGIGLPDIIGGFFAGLLTALGVCAVRRFHWNEWLAALPTIVVSALLVPVWLAPALQVPFWLLSVSIAVGEIPAGVLGVLLLKAVRRALPGYTQEQTKAARSEKGTETRADGR